MKRILWILLAFLLLTGCQHGQVPATGPSETATPTATTEPIQTAPPVTVPTETWEPTVPEETEPAFVAPERQTLSYEEFFAADRSYDRSTQNQWLVEKNGTTTLFRIRYSNDIITDDHGSEWPLPGGEAVAGMTLLGCDGHFAYYRSESQVVKLDLSSGQTQVILEEANWLRVDDYAVYVYLLGHDALYYATAGEDCVYLNRLYIPEMRLDVLYTVELEGTPISFFQFYKPTGTRSPLCWSMINPKLYAKIEKELQDPNSRYKTGDDQPDFSDIWGPDFSFDDYDTTYDNWLCYQIQQGTGIRTYLNGSYDPFSDTRTDRYSIIDSCWFGSGYAHDHGNPDAPAPEEPTLTIGEWVPIPGGTGGDTAPGIDSFSYCLVSDGFLPYRLYRTDGQSVTCLSNTPVTLAEFPYSSTGSWLYCFTAENTLIRVNVDGSGEELLYTAQYGELRQLSGNHGKVCFLDGNTVIEIDPQTMCLREVLRHDHITDMYYWETENVIYIEIASGLHYQQYLCDLAAGTIEKTHFL